MKNQVSDVRRSLKKLVKEKNAEDRIIENTKTQPILKMVGFFLSIKFMCNGEKTEIVLRFVV